MENYIQSEYTNLKFTVNNLFIYQVRNSIEKAVINNIKVLSGDILDLGCGYMPYKDIILNNKNVKSYTGMDIHSNEYYKNKPDIFWNGDIISSNDETYNGVVITEFLEHYHDSQHILKEIKRVLKKDGILFGTVPFIWNLHGIPFDEYRFTPFSLIKHFQNAGFVNVEIYPVGGKHAAMAQMLVIWFGISNFKFKRITKYIIFWICKLLIKNDAPQKKFDNWENSLFSGLYFIARK